MTAVQSPGERGVIGTAAWLYLWLLALGLVLQGVTALILWAIGSAPAFLDALYLLTHPGHSLLHVVWGVIMLSALVTRPSESVVIGLNLAFGVFYTVLAVVVATVGAPPGLDMTAEQDAFHFFVGPAALILGAAAWVEWRVGRNVSG